MTWRELKHHSSVKLITLVEAYWRERMGLFDVVLVPCPKCGKKYPAQSKGADMPMLECYELDDVPPQVLSDVNRHAPFTCDDEGCGTEFTVEYELAVKSVRVVKVVKLGDELSIKCECTLHDCKTVIHFTGKLAGQPLCQPCEKRECWKKEDE